MPAFKMGALVATSGVAAWAADGGAHRNEQLMDAIRRHLNCDWGDLDDEDKASNEMALRTGGRLLSSYTVEGSKLWVITEADRSVTTVLFPDEY